MNSLAAFSVMLVLQVPQQGHLIDAARRNGGKVAAGFNISLPIANFEDVAAKSDLIVRGTVKRVTTRLSNDGEYVVTDFEIIPVQVYKGVRNAITAPGTTNPLIVERVGGTVVIDGLEMTVNANLYPETESLHQGEDVFLFLSQNGATDFIFTDGPYGAYRIANDEVTSMTKHTAATRGEQPEPFVVFENRVRNLIRK
jgi:hypothetical protein